MTDRTTFTDGKQSPFTSSSEAVLVAVSNSQLAHTTGYIDHLNNTTKSWVQRNEIEIKVMGWSNRLCSQTVFTLIHTLPSLPSQKLSLVVSNGSHIQRLYAISQWLQKGGVLSPRIWMGDMAPLGVKCSKMAAFVGQEVWLRRNPSWLNCKQMRR